jgi:hypothetical protein
MGDNRDRETDIHGGRRTLNEPSDAETLAKAQKIYEQQGELSPRQRQAKKQSDANNRIREERRTKNVAEKVNDNLPSPSASVQLNLAGPKPRLRTHSLR